MQTNTHPDTFKQPSKGLIFAKKMFILLFPVITLLKLNRQLTRSEKIVKHEWFAKQKKRNLLVGLIVSLPLVLCLTSSFFLMKNDKYFLPLLGKSYTFATDFNVIKSSKAVYLAFTNDVSKDTIALSFKLVLGGVISSFIMGTIVMKNMVILKDSKTLVTLLKRNGIFDKDDDSRIALATPIGFLIDITGSNASELLHNERIWMALNIKVNDWAEDPDKRAIIFFKQAYELQSKYDYSLKDLKTIK